MTGAGKTYTMFGNIYDNSNDIYEKGLIIHMVKSLFERFQTKENQNKIFKVKFAYLEIYNEKIRDLLIDEDECTPKSLFIIEDSEKGVIIPNLTEYEI